MGYDFAPRYFFARSYAPFPTIPSLLFLNRCYWPDTEATGQLLTDLCQSLASDFDVQVVCGQPNSPAVGATYVRSGIQHHGGVTIHRLPHSQFEKRVPAGRLLNLASFTRAAANYLHRTSLTADCIISETDPFLLPIVAAKHARRIGAPFVCYLQDIYPDVAEAIGQAKPGWLTRRIRNSLRRSYDAADGIIVLGECMNSRLQSAPWSIDPIKLHVIPNWADCQEISPGERSQNRFLCEHRLRDRFVVMHSGNMGLTQRLDVLLQAAANPLWPENAVLLLVGDGAARKHLQAQAAALQATDLKLQALFAERVRFLPYQTREQLPDSLSAADLHVVSMHESISGCLCPSKLYGILAAGRPVLAIAAPETDLCATVSQFNLGATCVPGDSAAIASTIAAFAADRQRGNDSGTRARQIALTHFDRPIVFAKLKLLINHLLNADA